MEEKTTVLKVPMDEELKEQAEKILTTIGLTPTMAIQLFYKQITLRKGMPFPITIPDQEDMYPSIDKTKAYISDNSAYIIDDLE